MTTQSFDISGLDGVLRKLQELPKEVSQKRGGPVRAALRKGANLFKNAAQANIRKIVSIPSEGGDDHSTGVLENSVRVTRLTKLKGISGNFEAMRVGIPKGRKYPPSVKNPRGERVRLVGQRLEYGSSRLLNPHPWMRPAFHSQKTAVVNTVVSELNKGIARIVKKMSTQP